jgi:hypothetical protein
MSSFDDYNGGFGFEQDQKSLFFKGDLNKIRPLDMDSAEAFALSDASGKAGNIIKFSYNTGTLSGDTGVTAAGLCVKGYFEGGSIAGGLSEAAGFSVFFKDKITKSGGAKSSILSIHRHSESDQTTERGLAIFGDVSNGLVLSGTMTNVFEFISGNEGISAGSTKSTPGTVDKWLTIDINGTTHYLPSYVSKTT